MRQLRTMRAAGQWVSFRSEGHEEGTRADGPLVVLLHGTANNSYVWESVRYTLNSRGVDCVAVDMPGHGRSSSSGMAMRVYTLAGVLDAFCRKYTRRKLIVVGHSLGSVIAMELALQAPDLVQGLVLLSGPPV